MIYILASIVMICALIGVADLIVKIWDKLNPPKAEIIEIQSRKDNAA